MALKYGQTSDTIVTDSTYNFRLGHVERVFIQKNDIKIFTDFSTDSQLIQFTSVKGSTNQKTKQALIQAEAQAKEVSALLEKVNLEKSKLENQLNVVEKRHSREKAVLQDELEALKSSQFTENTETTESKDSPKNDTKTSSENRKKVAKGNYHIIIGSFQTRGMAELFLEDNGLDCKITFIKDLDTYRVVFSSHASLIEARKAKEEAQSITENAWIAVH